MSGAEGIIKPDPAIFQLLKSRYQLEGHHAVFIDDHAPNIEGARREGFKALQFTSAEQLRKDLAALGLPVEQA
ncbi:D-glucose-1-phosphatase [compost metagenome]